MVALKSLRIYESVRTQILSGALPPGARLVVRNLAHDHDTSDIPVREALRMLERDGLVEIIPYRGARVVLLSATEIEETYLIRGHLESLATRTAVGHFTDEQFAELDRCMQRMAEALDEDDSAAYAELNREFHGLIFRASPHRRLRELIEGLWDGQMSYRMVFHVSPERLRSSFREHGLILQALRDKDADLAASIALDHKLKVSNALIRAIDAAQDSGEPATDA